MILGHLRGLSGIFRVFEAVKLVLNFLKFSLLHF